MIAGAVYMHGEGLLILSGERQKQLQESIIAAEAECALVDEEEAQTKEEVYTKIMCKCKVISSCRRG